MHKEKILNILVTAGPTREPIDAVRFISNYSTGLLGYEIAKEAKQRGNRVILISGPTALAKPPGVRIIKVVTACQMKQEVENRFTWCDCLIMAAAVGDFRAKTRIKGKIKRSGTKELILRLKQNPDILGSLGCKKGKRMFIGFALETEDLKKHAQDKLRQKNLDLIVATQLKPRIDPFGPVRLDALIIDRTGHIKWVAQSTKTHLSRILLDRIEKGRDFS